MVETGEKIYPFNVAWALLWLFAAAATLIVKTEAMVLYAVGFVLLPTIVMMAFGLSKEVEKAWTEIDSVNHLFWALLWGLAAGYLMYFFFVGGWWAALASVMERSLSVIMPLSDVDGDGISDLFDSAPYDKFNVLYEPMTQGKILTTLSTSSTFASKVLGTFFAQVFVVGFGEEYLARLGFLSLLKKTNLDLIKKLLIVGTGFALLHFAVYPAALGSYIAAFIGGIFLAIIFLIGGLTKSAITHGTYNSLLILNISTGMLIPLLSNAVVIFVSFIVVGITLYFLYKAMDKAKIL